MILAIGYGAGREDWPNGIYRVIRLIFFLKDTRLLGFGYLCMSTFMRITINKQQCFHSERFPHVFYYKLAHGRVHL